MARLTATGTRRLRIADFSGGLNLRDSPSELDDNESPDCWNVELDNRGGVVKRLGLTKYNSSQLNTSAFKRVYYSPMLQIMVGQQGASLYTSTGSGVWSAIRKTFTSSATVGFCDFQGYIVCVHPVDGVWVSADGTTWSQTSGGAANMEAVRGNTVAAWQNKVWVGGDTFNKPRLWASNAGNPQLWTVASDYVDIRDKDNEKITCVGAGQGMDDIGRPGLLVFKEESCYRVYSANATTGFNYTTLSTHYGAAGTLAVCASEGMIGAISRKGIIVTDGVKEPVLVSAKVQPLFDPDQIAFAYSDLMAAGVAHQRHMVFSMPLVGSTVNSITLQYSPSVGWIVPMSFACSSFTNWLKNDAILYGSSTTAGYVYRCYSGGDDDGAAIAARFNTKWFEPTSSGLLRLRRVRMTGRGTYSLYVRGDYTTAQGTLCQVVIVGNSMLWGTGVWGTGTWGTQPVEDFQDFYSLGTAKAVSFNLTESSSNTATSAKLLQTLATETVGSFALYEIILDYIPLGGA